MTPDEKRSARLDKWRNPEVEFKNSQAEADYKARVDRLITAINLEKPDRVPINLNVGFWPARMAGLTPYDAMTDPTAGKAWVDFTLEFQADSMTDLASCTVPASIFEALDYKLYSWPGHGVPHEAGYQYNEKEWMLPEEYAHLISDPTDYLLSTYLPRTVGAFAGFAGLTALWDYIELAFVSAGVGGWASPEMLDGLEKLIQAARARNAWREGTVAPAVGEMLSLGFPPYRRGATKAPFDILGDTLRGTRGVSVDMYRRPGEVLAACERLTQIAIDWTLARRPDPATPIIFIPLHKGADGFMSDEQFHTFYWPTLRKLLIGLIDEGLIPLCFAEGRYNTRLETISDLPKGKTVWLFDQTDMARAKETIGKVACIEGNMPSSLLHAGTTDEVAAFTRNLIDVAGEGGGFIVDMGAVVDDGKAENLRTMIETAKEYGVY
jgi:hypothetical protein